MESVSHLLTKSKMLYVIQHGLSKAGTICDYGSPNPNY